MHVPSVAVLSALALSALASPIELGERDISERATKCVPAVVFALRGSDPEQETLGPNPRYNQLPSGMTAAANAVIKKHGGSSSSGLRPVKYPAINPSQENLDNGDYQKSVDEGSSHLTNDINNFAKACPKDKIFVIGYSQGAQAVSGALVGLKDPSKITAAVNFADPENSDGILPIDQGSGASDGVSGTAADPDTQGSLNSIYMKNFRTYCQAGDEFCDSGTGADAGTIHGNSPQHFQKQAIKFLTQF